MTFFSSRFEAEVYLKEQMRRRNFCENARSRALLALAQLPIPIAQEDVDAIVIGKKIQSEKR